MMIEATSAARGATLPFQGFNVGNTVEVKRDTSGTRIRYGRLSLFCNTEACDGLYTVAEVVNGGRSLVVDAAADAPSGDPAVTSSPTDDSPAPVAGEDPVAEGTATSDTTTEGGDTAED